MMPLNLTIRVPVKHLKSVQVDIITFRKDVVPGHYSCLFCNKVFSGDGVHVTYTTAGASVMEGYFHIDCFQKAGGPSVYS